MSINKNLLKSSNILSITNRRFFNNLKENLQNTKNLIMKPFNNIPDLKNNKWNEESKDYYDSHGHEYYELHSNDKLLFTKGKHNILKSNASFKRMLNLIKFGILSANIYCTYKSFKSLIFFRPIRTIFWGGLAFITFQMYNRTKNSVQYIIQSFFLYEDGKRIEVVSDVNKFITDISEVRKLRENEIIFFSKIMPGVHKQFYPLIINNQFFLIPKSVEISNLEVFNAITSGKYIKISEENKIHNKNTIDI